MGTTKGITIHALTDTDDLFGRPLQVGDVVAALTLFSGGSTWELCVSSLLEHTSETTPIVVFDDAGPSEIAVQELAEVEKRYGREVHYFRQPKNRGVVGNLNTAFQKLAPADVIVLNSDIIVGPEWDTRLIAAARSRSDIATATALSANATIFTVEGPDSWKLQPPTVAEFAEVARKVSAASKQVRPFVPVATSFCTLFARHALNVVGLLDEEFSPGYGEEVDYSLRCVSYGFNHIAVDDVYAYHATGESFGEVALNWRKIDNDELVARRFEYWNDWISEFAADEATPLERVRRYTYAVIHGLTIAIDAELVHPNLTGTFEGSFALSRKLALHPDVQRVIWVASGERVGPLRAMLAEAKVDTIEVSTIADLYAAKVDVDLAFRPYQDFTGATWPAISGFSRRNMIWMLDLIALLNPHYAVDYDDFAAKNAVARKGWENADAIGVLTPHVAKTLTAYYSGTSDSDKIVVLPNGSPEQPAPAAGAWNLENAGLEALADTPYILVLGTNYLHKNVPWLMRVGLRLKSLGWEGRFVFAGPTPDSGHSAQLEADLIELSGADCFTFLGRVSDSDKIRLISGATLVASPSITEGWGMIPGEAVHYGSTPISSRGGGLGDIGPADAKYLEFRDDEADAQTLLELVNDLDARQRQRELWEAATQQYQWADTAQTVVTAGFDALLRHRQFRLDERTAQKIVLTGAPSVARRLADSSVTLLPVGSRRRRVVKRLLGGAAE
ncbi:glycosyltransferase [Herbiconiux sp. KACC 21604]|uniref:glycosyltransferase n=1 Tax=unclassified Herbiconiux TaxID=2618217 RepID=UPI00149171BD|nr:glycosyltransferase [Herbiconiux sp. SALV-R1]QJU54439.1 glycosyltransferase [Herbiconiux sp. SALV-R1]WPO85515.1 glycosyltransferase [Herbiconiux sp. KACC 21604]